MESVGATIVAVRPRPLMLPLSLSLSVYKPLKIVSIARRAQADMKAHNGGHELKNNEFIRLFPTMSILSMLSVGCDLCVGLV